MRIGDGLLGRLTALERERLERKLRLVELVAARLACGMLKGTIKYRYEESDTETLTAHMDDEILDFLNYWVIRRAAEERAKLGTD